MTVSSDQITYLTDSNRRKTMLLGKAIVELELTRKLLKKIQSGVSTDTRDLIKRIDAIAECVNECSH